MVDWKLGPRSWRLMGVTVCAATWAFAAPSFAQDTPTETPAEETEASTESAAPASDDTETAEQPTDPAAEVLSTGEPVRPANQGPAIYVREEHGDWEVRCLEAPEGQDDPCQLYQRLSDQSGNPTADINIFDLPDGNEIVAGGTLLTPLRTLLTAQVTVTVDGGQARRYPYSFCDASGCYARMGFTAADVAAFRRGAKATVVVVPAQAPDQAAQLTMSLTGFTAGYQAVTVDNN
ncbi:invasion-associated locus B family protein [Jannaschia pagri]|uniref:Invasion-associated locus B family protein n=1 Tax=Jannaschia pagri TaxID=2829797 RepID=A0ABQ4NNL5_9RHOB|nr:MULTISPECIES: invasion associated locus B family protein [unclassified Jannaschia]GIT92167.1 invasion-associated locus B family protein [Jannaschia sp. AI_61]GIT96002.1 invasion-associated locus B family protein [Jannaschia sp. AI_62]